MEPYWNFKVQRLGITGEFMVWGFVYYELQRTGVYWASTKIYKASLN
jgi:hypothetical protein